MGVAQLRRKRRWRGRDRGNLRKLQKGLIALSVREMKMSAYADANGVQGLFFDNTTDASITDAMQLLMDRIDACLVELTN